MDNDISEMMRRFSDMMGSSAAKEPSSDSSNFDVNTVLKLKNIMDNMKDENNPRSNLLKSLKPYLKESRKQKVDQYINLFNMGKIMQLFQNQK